MQSFNRENFYSLCDHLARQDDRLAFILSQHGYPPYWSRNNTFETLVHIILEQQVSLASALSALNKLKEKIGEISPARILLLTDEELKACYFSRQKTNYIKYLAEALLSGKLNLKTLETLPEEQVRGQLTALKGIGNWTVDVYLIFVLHRLDIFPLGDLAVVSAVKKLNNLPQKTPPEDIAAIAGKWRPYQTLATMLLWHYYLQQRKR